MRVLVALCMPIGGPPAPHMLPDAMQYQAELSFIAPLPGPVGTRQPPVPAQSEGNRKS